VVSEISVVLAEDNAALRGLLDAFLRVRHDLVVLGVCSDGLSAVELALDTHADVALLDDVMPRMGGVDAAKLIRACAPTTEPVLFTVAPDTVAAEAAEMGIRVLNKLDAWNLSAEIRAAGEEARARPRLPFKAHVARSVLNGLAPSHASRNRRVRAQDRFKNA
jgi:DNA-binding NarL/FixJ family response regulator